MNFFYGYGYGTAKPVKILISVEFGYEDGNENIFFYGDEYVIAKHIPAPLPSLVLTCAYARIFIYFFT